MIVPVILIIIKKNKKTTKRHNYVFEIVKKLYYLRLQLSYAVFFNYQKLTIASYLT